MRKRFAIAALVLALVPAWGCSSEISGRLEREKLFVPLLGFGRAYVRIDLQSQAKAGGILIKYLDFSGKRVALEMIPLPGRRTHWAGVMGRGARKNGKAYYGLKIERFGPVEGPLPYTFKPLAGPNPGPLGLFDRQS